MDDLLFAKWNIPNIDKKAVLAHIFDLPEKCWFYEPYRNTMMLPFSTKGGDTGYKGTTNYRSGEFEWTPYTPVILKEWCQDVLFPALGMKTRIVILKTPPNTANNEHIDCDRQHQFTRQHKFRIVLQGQTSTLYFIKKTGNVFAPDIDGPFIMDGSWPHGMYNTDNKTKYTLTAGAPWDGLEHYNNLNILLKRHNTELPENYTKYYKNDENPRMA